MSKPLFDSCHYFDKYSLYELFLNLKILFVYYVFENVDCTGVHFSSVLNFTAAICI